MKPLRDDSSTMHVWWQEVAKRHPWFALAALLTLACALSACGKPSNTRLAPTETASTNMLSAPTATAPAGVSPGATPFAGTPSPLRTPGLKDSTCFLMDNEATPTAAALAQTHGTPVSCDQLGRAVFVGVEGGTDPRPGFLACAQPPAATEDYCGIGLAPVIARDRSYASNWQFYPFPAANAKAVGDPAFPQLYRCVGDGSQLWTFHFDTLTYTGGCTLPPAKPYPPLDLPCDEFLYFGVHTAPNQFYELYRTYGKAAACARYGTTVIGVVDGNPQSGLVVCGGATPSLLDTQRACGFELGLPGVPLSVWKFIPLPVASGPVTSAAFDTAAGTACVTAAGRPFTFTLATLAVTAGCSGSPAPAATP